MSHEMISEATQIEELREGSQEALAALFARYSPRLTKIVRFRLDPRLARRISELDVLQDTYLRASQRIDHFVSADPPFSAFVWFRLLVNQQLSELYRKHFGAEMRDARRELFIESENAAKQTTSQSLMHFLLATNSKTPSQIISHHEQLDRVEATLNQMSQLDQEMIALRHFEELSNSEAAEVLRISSATARKRYVRAMHRLRERMNMMDSDKGLTPE